MKIKLLTCLSGAKTHLKGEIIELSENEAKALIEKELAIEVDEAKALNLESEKKEAKTSKITSKKAKNEV